MVEEDDDISFPSYYLVLQARPTRELCIIRGGNYRQLNKYGTGTCTTEPVPSSASLEFGALSKFIFPPKQIPLRLHPFVFVCKRLKDSASVRTFSV